MKADSGKALTDALDRLDRMAQEEEAGGESDEQDRLAAASRLALEHGYNQAEAEWLVDTVLRFYGSTEDV